MSPKVSYKRCNICCLFEKIFFYFLWKKYKFDYWHATAPWSCRPYKKQVVNLANKCSPNSAIEIGCGLGDIIGRVNADLRYGFDIDIKALNAAKFLYAKKVRFETVSLSDIDIMESYLSNTSIINLLIMVNWVHNISFKDLLINISKMKKGLNIEYLIIDGIKTNVNGYQFKHTKEQFSELGKIESCIEAVDGVRFIYLIKLSSVL
jgi:hypothetical protein